VVPENIHKHLVDGHWQFCGVWGFSKAKIKKKGVKGNWNFWRGGVFKVKTSMGEVWIFSLEPHNGKQCGRRLADLGFSIPTT